MTLGTPVSGPDGPVDRAGPHVAAANEWLPGEGFVSGLAQETSADREHGARPSERSDCCPDLSADCCLEVVGRHAEESLAMALAEHYLGGEVDAFVADLDCIWSRNKLLDFGLLLSAE